MDLDSFAHTTADTLQAEKFAAERETFDAERAGAQGYINHLNDTFLTQLQEAQAKAMSEANQKAAAVIVSQV